MKEYTATELAIRNGLNGNACWVSYKGYIYDVTSSPLFRNGRHYRVQTLGIDLTDQMEEAPHLEDVLQKFAVVGRLV